MRFAAAIVLAVTLGQAGAAAPAGDMAHVGPFSGPLAVNGEANFIGAKACFDAVNAQGGIGGRKIRFVREDDAHKPEETARDMRSQGEGASIYWLSHVPPDLVVAKAGLASAAGVALAEVTPNPNSDATRLMRDFHAALKQYAPKDAAPSSLSLQGYIETASSSRRSGVTARQTRPPSRAPCAGCASTSA